MQPDPKRRLDLETWLADLRRLGGQARTLSERPESVRSFMDLSDLQMLEEAAKRIIVSLSKNAIYVLPPSERWSDVRADRALPAVGSTRHRAMQQEVPTPEITERGPSPANGIIGQTEAMLRVQALISKASACSLPVLIQGESGTGKELVARAIHDSSDRCARRFFSENCSALSESLLESELFGHVRGAFTGADRDRKGILELADGGTLFLDEIGDMSVRMQSKLLRALQEREFRPVGGKETVRVDVRIISATNRSLRGLMKEGSFRGDLFYRINVIAIDLPPLRERKQDIPALLEHFLERIASETGLPRKTVSHGTLALLTGYDWPGNIRELENAIQRAVALSDAQCIDAADLPDRVRHVMVTEEMPQYSGDGKGGEHLMIEKALHNFEGDKTRASRFIGWSRPKLYRRMRFHGIPIHFGRPRSHPLDPPLTSASPRT